jgi:hypothetical protein
MIATAPIAAKTRVNHILSSVQRRRRYGFSQACRQLPDLAEHSTSSFNPNRGSEWTIFNDLLHGPAVDSTAQQRIDCIPSLPGVCTCSTSHRSGQLTYRHILVLNSRVEQYTLRDNAHIMAFSVTRNIRGFDMVRSSNICCGQLCAPRFCYLRISW